MIIKNGNVFTPDFRFEKADVRIENGAIAEIGSIGGEDVLDAEGMYVIPGLIDQHTHGSVGGDWGDGKIEDMRTMSEYYGKNGVTSVAATVTTLKVEDVEAAMRAIKSFGDEQKREITGARVRGINLESMFLSKAKKGAHLEEYLRLPDAELVERLNEASGGLLRIVNVAPELEGAMDFIRTLSGRFVISVAHTACGYATALEAREAGARQVTHFFNAMTSFLHREPGVPGAVFDSDLNAELICDGVHVHPSVIRAVFRLMADRVIMISDSIRACGLSDGEYILGDLPVTVKAGRATLKDGTIAGSAASVMDDLRSVTSFGVPLEQAVRAATYNPAKTLGIDGRVGRIIPGYDADIVVLDRELNVRNVFIGGKKIV